METTRSSLGHAPADRWEFDGDVTDVFDDMLVRSIPQLDVMRDAVFELGRRFVRPSSAIVDLGCARGDALARFVDAFHGKQKNTFLGLETSRPMVDAARRRFEGTTDVFVNERDLRDGLPNVKTSLVLSVLTLQFVPINYRQRIVAETFERLTPGGAFVLVEKVLGSGAIDEQMVNVYHDLKRANGYTSDEVERKRLALEGVLVPVTAHWNEQLLADAGFRPVDCFWRWMNFAGWLAVKPR